MSHRKPTAELEPPADDREALLANALLAQVGSAWRRGLANYSSEQAREADGRWAAVIRTAGEADRASGNAHRFVPERTTADVARHHDHAAAAHDTAARAAQDARQHLPDDAPKARAAELDHRMAQHGAIARYHRDQAERLRSIAGQPTPTPAMANAGDLPGHPFRGNQHTSSINWDAKEGMGAAPNQQDIGYFGFQRSMTPREFIGLAAPGVQPRSQQVLDMAQAMREGKPVGPPMLSARWKPEARAWQVESHEGRHRSLAVAQIDPEHQMPVHIFPMGGLRARDLTAEMRAASLLPESKPN